MNVAALLVERAMRAPNVTAIIDERRKERCTYAELHRRVVGVSEQLRQSGLAPGDRVVIAVRMSLDLYVVLLAVWHSGLVAIVPDASSGFKAMERGLSMTSPKAIIAEQRLALMIPFIAACRSISMKFCLGFLPGMRRLNSIGASLHDETPVDRADNDPALLTFTSGSTGLPKAVVRTHGIVQAQMRAILATVDLGSVTLETMPIVLLANLAAGGTSVIPSVNLRAVGKSDPAELARTISRNLCTTMIASPAVLERMAASAKAADERVATLTDVYSGGAPVFPVVLAEFGRIATAARLHVVYGSTEAEPIAHLEAAMTTPDALHRMECGAGLLVGKPVDTIRIEILRSRWGEPIGPLSFEDFAKLRTEKTEPGEIVVTGAHVIPGYLNGTGDAETKIHVEGQVFHRTGDAGFLDEAGLLWLLGRAASVIRDQRGTLYPLAVECAASFLPGVKRSAVIAIGESRILFVQSEGADMSTIKSRLAWAALDHVCRIDEIPVDRRHNAKVDYPRLVKLAIQFERSRTPRGNYA